MIEVPSKPFFQFSVATELSSDKVNLLGIPFDGTSCFRKGADGGPQAIRNVSDSLEDYSPYLEQELNPRLLADVGDLVVDQENFEKHHRFFHQWANQTRHPGPLITIGGEHSISLSPIQWHLARFPDLTLLHLDAHADLRDGLEGYHYSHASIIFRALENFGPDHRLIQYGIRSGTRQEFEMMNAKQTQCLSRQQFLARVKELGERTPIYLTLDLDYFDPAFVPGTGTPEAGGEDFHSLIALLKILAQKNLVGADVVELAPELDPTGCSSCLAAKVVRELTVTLQARL